MKLLLTGAYHWNTGQMDELKEMGFEIVFLEREDADLCFDFSDIDAVVCNWLFFNHDIAAFQKLKYVQLLSAGLDRIPLDYIKKHQIILHNARGVYSIPVAEFAIAGVLALYKRLFFFYERKKEVKWEKNREIRELYQERVLVVGTGNIGTEVAKRFGAFTDNIYGVDISPRQNPYMKHVFPVSQICQQLQESDIVILALPLTKETTGLFSEELFSHIKQNAVFVNISRGGIVEETALCRSLDNRLSGAVLDVFQEEPLGEENPLWKKENVIITPHNSFVSKNNDGRMWEVIRDNMLHFRQNNQ